MNNRVDIQFKGLTTSPSDYACSDGELAICHNVINENGELRPIAAPRKKYQILPSALKLVYIHKTDTGTMFIAHDTDNDELLSTPERDGAGTYVRPQFASLLSGGYDEITSIGNMLIVTQSTVDHYFIKKGNVYSYLGNELPMLPKIAFGMHTVAGGGTSGSVIRKEYKDISTFHVDSTELEVNFTSSSTYLSPSSDSGQTLYNALMGALSSVENEAKRVGGFVNPFFVRFAYRLKDHGESIARLSPPVLMTPRTTHATVFVEAVTDNSKVRITGSSQLSFLRYCVMGAPDYTEWEDIIDSIEVFVSSPIKTYNNLEFVEYESWRSRLPKMAMRSPSMCMHDSTGYPKRGKIYGCYDIVSRSFTGTPDYKIGADGNINYKDFEITAETASDAPDTSAVFNGQFMAPFKSPEELSEELASTGSFYHVATIPVSDIKSDPENFKRVPIENGALIALENREAVKEDYLSNYRVNASGHRVYNRRLIKVGSSRDITTNFALTTMEQYIFHGSRFGAPSCKVLVKKKDTQYLVDLGPSVLPVNYTSQWLFYPDPDASEIRFYSASPSTGEAYKKVTLSRHDYLQGAYWKPSDMSENFAMSEFESVQASIAPPDPTNDYTKVPIKSIVYVSEVDNPFFFPSGLTAQLGNGNVLALAATTLPISEGQQGQFPLMAFTDEGIWALSITSNGSITATNPMLRDVLLSKGSVCSLPDGVAYTTAKGIMVLRGGRSTCISDAVIERMVEPAMITPHIASVVGNRANLPNNFYLRPHLPYVKLLYSEQTNRLFVIGENDIAWPSSFAFVYSLESGRWSTMDFPYSLPVENYPTVYVQKIDADDSTGAEMTSVYDLGDFDYANSSGDALPQGGGVVLTRPLTFGSRNTTKTIFESIVRGDIVERFVMARYENEKGELKYADRHETSEVKQILYGSNDMHKWVVVNSSDSHRMRGRAGTPYKYFRHAILVPVFSSIMTSITNVEYDVQLRLNNTLR